MKGREIFDKYQKLRDRSGSKDDEYAQLLDTIEVYAVLCNYEKEFYSLLEKAENQGNRLSVEYPPGICIDGIYINNIIIV